MKDIFKEFAEQLVSDIGHNNWDMAILFLMRLEGTVQFKGEYLNGNVRKDIDVNFGFWLGRKVHELYYITQNEPPIHANWNRAKFTLFPNGKMEMEYIWDQTLQDEVDGYNNDNNTTIV